MERPAQRFVPALEGVRGYAFIVVFLVHFHRVLTRPPETWLMPYFLFLSLGWLAVPLFFAVSGYLITQILYRSKGREGYFRVFYGRRALRVLPLYYSVLGVVAVATVLRHWHWTKVYLTYFFYLQNFTRSRSIFLIGPHVGLGHLWSMSLEEQFYLLWPLVIRYCPDRKSMLRVCYAVLIFCFAARVCWPLFDLPFVDGYYSTLTRADGIICGAMIALWLEDREMPKWMPTTAKWAALGGVFILLVRAWFYGRSLPDVYSNLTLMVPIANVISTALLVLLLVENAWLARVSSHRWICWLGRMSYGLYLFHNLYLGYFQDVVAPALTPAMGVMAARVVSGSLAFLLTVLLAKLSFDLLETPALRLKHLFQYGPMVQREVAFNRSPEPQLPQTAG